MKSGVRWVRASWLLLVWAGCQTADAPDCLRSTGPITREVRTLPLFFGLELYDGVEVVFTPDTVQVVEVEAGRHLLPEVYTEVADALLRIGDRNRCRWVRRYDVSLRVHIRSPSLYFFRLYGFGDLQVTDTLRGPACHLLHYGRGRAMLALRTDELILDQNGVGTTVLGGSTRTALVQVQDIGPLEAGSLRAQSWRVIHRAVADARIGPGDTLRVTVESWGSLRHGGAPVIVRDGDGSGQVIAER